MELNNQILIQKVENGFLITLRVENELSGILGGVLNKNGLLKDKKHYIAKTKEELIEIIKEKSMSLLNEEEIETKLLKEQELLK